MYRLQYIFECASNVQEVVIGWLYHRLYGCNVQMFIKEPACNVGEFIIEHPYRISAGLEVIKLEYILRLKIKHNDWLLADTCPQSANHCVLF